MRALLLSFSALLLIAAGPSQTSSNPEQRIVSTALCADTYVLAAAAPHQIAALSWQADDALSLAAPDLRIRAKARDDAEVLLALKPDLVVFGPGEGAKTAPLLAQNGIATITLNWVENFDGIQSNQAVLASALGQAAPPSAHKPADPTGLSVLYLSRAGGSAGPGTYVDAAIRAAGGRNIITTPGWHTPPLEALIPLKPDLIVTSFFQSGYESVNDTGLRHPVLRRKLNSVPRLDIPGSLWPCAGPGLATASEMIQSKLAELSGA